MTGLFPRGRSNHTRPRYLRLLAQVPRFHRQARRLLATPGSERVSLAEFLASGGYSRYFVDHFVVPVVSAVWSADEVLAAGYPARYLFRFLANHGLLSVGGSPRWRTVVGGSREYVARVVKGLTEVAPATPIRALRRHADAVLVTDGHGVVRWFDRVVVATHPDQALELLTDATPAEREVLGAFRYARNQAILHRDTSLLPTAAGARASWNYLKTHCRGTDAPVLVSYHMNRLQRLAGPGEYLVTLNPSDRIAPGKVLARMSYQHPVYTVESVAAQRRLPELTSATTTFAGAYHGWGFHEDGCASGVRAAEAFGVIW